MQVLLTTCKDRIERLLEQMHQIGADQTILLQSEQKANAVALNSARGENNDRLTALDSSALKPKKLTFAGSPSKQFSLLDSDKKYDEDGV